MEATKTSNDPVISLMKERDEFKARLSDAMKALDAERERWRVADTAKRDAEIKAEAFEKQVEALREERDNLAKLLDSRPFRPDDSEANGLDLTHDQVTAVARESATLRGLLKARYGNDLLQAKLDEEKRLDFIKQAFEDRGNLRLSDKPIPEFDPVSATLDEDTADPSLGDIVSDEAQGIDPKIIKAFDATFESDLVSEKAAESIAQMFEAGHACADVKALTVLEEAAKIVDGPRRQHYGHPAENHGRTALYWNAYLGIDPSSPDAIDGHDVCQMNNLQKISRESGKGRKPRRQRDTLVDQCGYSRNAEIIDLTEEE